MLPQEFTDRMKDMLGEEYPEFEESYQREKYQALRMNPLKTDRETFVKKIQFPLNEVAWEENGLYFDAEDKPGKHPFHEAGVYYIQEPSAMLPAVLLEAGPGERVLDLCAGAGRKEHPAGSCNERERDPGVQRDPSGAGEDPL